MLRKQLSKSSEPSTIFTAKTSFTEVQCFVAFVTRGEYNLTHVVDLKPENLLYQTKDPNSVLVLADFGIAKMLDTKDEVLTTMAGSFGYAAPEVMLKKGHGKPVDMWSMGVITYTLLCGYSPFRSENLQDLIDECSSANVVFHERYWRDVSDDAKDFIMSLLRPDPEDRSSSSVCSG
jgi:calcium/calmodulin-dependent protein kinase I